MQYNNYSLHYRMAFLLSVFTFNLITSDGTSIHTTNIYTLCCIVQINLGLLFVMSCIYNDKVNHFNCFDMLEILFHIIIWLNIHIIIWLIWT